MINLGSEPTNLPENLGLHLPGKPREYLCKSSPELDHLKVEEGIIDGSGYTSVYLEI